MSEVEIELMKELHEVRKIHSGLTFRILSMESVLYSRKKAQKPIPEIIEQFINDVMAETRVDFLKHNRKEKNTMIRNIIMYLFTNNFSGVLTLKEIGQIVGGKDHSTVLHAKSKVQDMIDTKYDFYLNGIETIKPIFDKYFNING